MATTGFESQNEPLKGQDGKYQIRIESYDPARNTMKAIWLVSRNQRLLSQLVSGGDDSLTFALAFLKALAEEDRHEGQRHACSNCVARALGWFDVGVCARAVGQV